ncbi:MAG: GAF domain-containing protein [Deltaproteobacteria bacterium]|nr:MAG: GAF domain-containing protein [Deltaproteobacteria bacterium]
MGNATVSQGRADHRACAPGNLHRMLLDVSHATASHRDLKSLLSDLAGLLRRVARFDRLALVLHDPERDLMRLHTIVSLEPTFTTDIELPVPESPAGLVWQTQRPLVVPRIDGETRFAEVRRILRAEGMRSFCILPLTTPLRRLGGLSFASQEEDAFSEADVDVLQELTSQVALAVDNTLHHEAAQRAQRQLASERDRLRLLLEVNNALVSNLEPRALFSAIASCLRRVVAHDYTSLAVYDRERNAFDMWAIEFAGKGLIKEHMFVPVEGSPAGRAFTAGEPVQFGRADLAALDSDVGRMLLAEGIQSMCSVPLTVHDRRLGTLSIGRLGGEPFTDCAAELLASVASQVAFSVENALAFQEIAQLKDKLAAEKVYLEDEIRTEYNFEDIIGESSALKRVLHQVETVAPTDSAVLIRGETGTGKELIARAIHDLSGRRGRTFVKVNCAAIPTGLLESELFGHERGAFTGAIAQRIGRFELADGGTLFLDEVGDIPLELQPKLLRVLQEREFERLGSTRTKRVDVRVVAATNRNLEEMVAAGTFRNDLYYRVNVFPITLPALRERPEDIPPLVRYFVQTFARRMNKRIETIPADAMTALSSYAWPGNVRELENAIERAIILTNGPTLRIPMSEFRGRALASSSAATTLEATERDAILRALRETNWVLGGPHGAAARLGLKRTTLQSRIQKLGIDRSTA